MLPPTSDQMMKAALLGDVHRPCGFRKVDSVAIPKASLRPTQTVLDDALKCANLNWYLLPICWIDEENRCSCGKVECSSPGKHPIAAVVPHGLKDASSDPERIRGWWSKYPDANIAVRTGLKSGLCVLDIDTRHGGEQSLRELVRQNHRLPTTVEASTGGGGRHLYFKHSDHPIKNRVNILPGIDLRGDEGYVVAPPSRHVSGNLYQWKAGYSPQHLKPAPMPAWLLNRLMGPNLSAKHEEDPSRHRADDNDARILVVAAQRYVSKACAVKEGQRNNTAFNLAGHLFAFELENSGFRLDDADVLGLMRPWNDRNNPPLAEAELEKAVASARKNGNPRPAHVVDRVPSQPKGLPGVILPGGPDRVSDAARRLGKLLAGTDQFFLRGGVVVRLDHDEHRTPGLRSVKPAELVSAFEAVAQLKRRNNKGRFEPTICGEGMAKLILNAKNFLDQFPLIRVVTPCPVLIERDGQLVQVTGYDRESGILAHGELVPEMSIEKAGQVISDLLSDFHFATPADRSRALAAIITPALVSGGLLDGRAPVDMGEADESQAGKGYRNKITAAIYGQTVKTVAQRRGGVGSLEESFNAALIRAANFICLDNVRGNIDSQAIESFLTEDTYSARIPYSSNMEIDPRRVIVMMTSNRAEITRDLANRSSCVRILKQPPGHMFREYPEGDILDHIRANSGRYLGAMFAVVRTWHAQGKPRTKETQHDFRSWARTLDWIVQNLLGAAPLMEGHHEAQRRMANTALTWLRDVALAVRRAGRLDQALRAWQILEIIQDSPEIETSGIRDDANLDEKDTRSQALRTLGRLIAKCFGTDDAVQIDHITVERHEIPDDDWRTVKEYTFRAGDSAQVLKPPIPPHTPPSPRGSDIFEKTTRGGPKGESANIKVYDPRGVCGGTRGDAGNRGAEKGDNHPDGEKHPSGVKPQQCETAKRIHQQGGSISVDQWAQIRGLGAEAAEVELQGLVDAGLGSWSDSQLGIHGPPSPKTFRLTRLPESQEVEL